MEQTEKKKVEFGPADNYTKEFILRKGGDGGYRKVAKDIGAVPATLQQVVENRNKAGRDTIAKLYQYYDDFDLTMAITGKPGKVEGSFLASQDVAPTQLSETAEDIIQKLTDRLISLSQRYERLEDKYENTREAYATYKDNVIRKYAPELSFSKSSGHVTASTESNQQIAAANISVSPGFKPSYMDKDAKVLVHPATLVNYPVMRQLRVAQF